MAEQNFLYFETYGCSANLNNTEIMRALIKKSGLEITNNPELADFLIINSCVVKEPTINKILARIKELKKLGKPIILAGCMPEVRKIKNVYMLGTHHVRDIIKLIRKIKENNYDASELLLNSDSAQKSEQAEKIFDKKEFLEFRNETKLLTGKIPEQKLIGITQILEGCQGECSFCLTRQAKHRLFSYSQDEILENIKSDLENGAKEIWITSQDNASYGLDRNKPELIELLTKILNLPGKFRIRLGMMNPNNILPILDELIEIYKNEKIYKFLHIPIQSASNKILKLMRRKYKIEDAEKIIKKFKAEIPDTSETLPVSDSAQKSDNKRISDITLATDIIAGFPGETEADFQESLDFIEKYKFDVINTNRFWPMRNTEASKMIQVDKKIIADRAERMMNLFRKVSREKNEKLLGQETEVLVYDKFQDNYLARNSSYKLVVLKSNENILGKILKIKITGIKQNHLIGEINS